MDSWTEEAKMMYETAWEDFDHGRTERATLSTLAAIAAGLLAVADALTASNDTAEHQDEEATK